MTLSELVEQARVVVGRDLGTDAFWQQLATNQTVDYESCGLCGCDIDSSARGPNVDRHEDWCPTLIARRVLGLPPQKPRRK